MPKQGTLSRRSLSSKEWHKELLLSWLFQTCFKLQPALDQIRKEMFIGVLDSEIQQLGKTLPRLHHNAVSFGNRRQVLKGRPKKRIGENRTGLHRVDAFRFQESPAAVALSVQSLSERKNDREHKQADDRLAQAESVSSESGNEHVSCSPTETL